MKKNNIIVIKISLIYVIAILICNTISFGENQTTTNSTNNNISSNISNNIVTNTNVKNTTNNISNINNNESKTKNKNVIVNDTKQSNVKSSNANLLNLGIKPNDFSGFNANKTSYSVTVPNNVDKVEVYATKKDSKAVVSGIGIKELKEGENIANVLVTAEDGTTKTYTINITRLKEGEELPTSNNGTTLGLSELKIEGQNLNPSFSSNIYEYTIDLKGDATTLDITANANNTNSKVQIIGNENLQDGQNIITILLTSQDETEVLTYQIVVNKNMVDQEKINKKEMIKKCALGLLIIIVILVIIIILRSKRNRKKEKLYNNDKENDLPKSFKNKIDKEETKDNKNTKKSKSKHSGKRYK